MQITSIKHANYNNGFKGWDATVPLKSVVFVNPGYEYKIAEEVDAIGKKNDFDVLILSDKKLKTLDEIKKEVLRKQEENKLKKPLIIRFSEAFLKQMDRIALEIIPQKPDRKNRSSQWVQDTALVTPNNNIIYNTLETEVADNIADMFGNHKSIYNFNVGGNLYYIKNKKGYELLAGRGARKIFFNSSKSGKKNINYDELKTHFGVNKITFLPQMDFHLDLYVRPLDNKRVLLVDDNMTIAIIEEAILKLSKLPANGEEYKGQYDYVKEKLSYLSSIFNRHMKINNYSKTDKCEKILKQNGFEVIKVPGRLYKCWPKPACPVHRMNFMNAIVTKNKQGELVYITNHSTLDEDIGLNAHVSQKIGFNFHEAFKRSISGYVKPENVYFVSGYLDEISRKLEEDMGGLHCLTMEIPNLK